MARISRRTGPTVGFAIPEVFTLIPGLSVTRLFDDGELLILISALPDNGGVSASDFQIRATVDGQALTPGRFSTQLLPGENPTVTGFYLHPINAGIHTINLECLEDVNTGSTILADLSTLIVIQLPTWDQADDLS